MSFEPRVARQAAAYLTRLDRPTQQRIVTRLRQIAEDPYGPHTKRLSNAEGRRAARVGGWRIIFAVDDRDRRIDVTVIAPRGRAYRDL